MIEQSVFAEVSQSEAHHVTRSHQHKEGGLAQNRPHILHSYLLVLFSFQHHLTTITLDNFEIDPNQSKAEINNIRYTAIPLGILYKK